MIQQVSLHHGFVPYEFMLHKQKLELLDQKGFQKVKSYLRESFGNCPEAPFKTGPRSSKLKFNLGIETLKIENHEVSDLAKKGLEWNRFKTAHSNVQVFMLANDSSTLSVEVPLWLHPEECDDALKKKLKQHFQEEGPLSGHVDILRLEGDKIWIWDYKPRADKEKYATTQTYFYAVMMSKRTGIPLDHFMCGYFDDKTSFIFKPDMKYLLN